MLQMTAGQHPRGRLLGGLVRVFTVVTRDSPSQSCYSSRLLNLFHCNPAAAPVAASDSEGDTPAHESESGSGSGSGSENTTAAPAASSSASPSAAAATAATTQSVAGVSAAHCLPMFHTTCPILLLHVALTNGSAVPCGNRRLCQISSRALASQSSPVMADALLTG